MVDITQWIPVKLSAWTGSDENLGWRSAFPAEAVNGSGVGDTV